MAMTVESQSKHGFHLANLILIALGVLAVLGIGWSAFIKPTNKNIIQDGATQVNVYEKPKVDLVGCGIWNLKAQVYWQTPTQTGGKK